MQVSVSRISTVLMEVSVEVPKETVANEVERAYLSLGKRAHIKGYRPGKVPRNVLKQLFAPQVANDVANAIVQNTLPKALSEQNMVPINQPAVEAANFEVNAAFSYKARFEVQPELTDVKFEGLELERPNADVDDKLVDEELEGLRKMKARLEAPATARPAKAGDVVTIDFTLSVDGKDLKDGGGQGIQLELGAGQALPELDAGLMGATVGANLKIEAKFADAHPSADLKGKTGTFAVTVSDLKEKVLPALDDEFAKDVGSFQTLVELRADIHSKLQKAMKDRAETALAEQVVLRLNELNPGDVPSSLIDAQARMMEQEFAMQVRRFGQRFTEEQARGVLGQIRIDAEKKVRAGLVMAAIAKKNEFKVTEEDIEKGLVELSEETGKNVNKLRVEYREKQKRDVLVGMILEDKILDFIEGKAKITDLPKGEEPKLLAKAKADAQAASGEGVEK